MSNKKFHLAQVAPEVVNPSYEYVLISPEGYRIAHGYSESYAYAAGAAADLLCDYPRCTCRIYRYDRWDSDPVKVGCLK